MSKFLASKAIGNSTITTLSGFFPRLRRKFGEVGWRYSLYLISLRLQRPGVFQFRKVFVTAVDLHQKSSILPQGLRVREATENDVERLFGLGDTERALHEKFANGHRVWALERDGRFVACDWLLPSDKRMSDWLILERDDGDIWSEIIFVHKDHRGQGLGPVLRGHVVQQCRRLGFSRMLGIIDTLNRNSVRAMGKIGYEAIGRLWFVRILGVAFIHDGTGWRCGVWRKGRPLRISVSRLAEAPAPNEWRLMQSAKKGQMQEQVWRTRSLSSAPRS